MAFDFPSAPTNGQIYTDTASGIWYTWDGEVWRSGTTAAAPDTFVLKAGDSMLGVLNLIDPDPVQPVQATHKKYVDRLIAEMSLYQGTWMVATNIPDLNVPPNAPLNGYSWVAQTVDPNVPELAPLTIPGIGGSMISALDTIKWSTAKSEYEQIQGAVSISQMTIADTPPTGGFHGQCWWDSDSGKQYVFYIDPSGDGYWVQMSGGGGTVFSDAPTDAQLYGRQSPTAGAVPAWVPIVVSATIASDTPPASPGVNQLRWNTTDSTLCIWYGGAWVQCSVEEAPQDGAKYVRQNGSWVVA